MKFYKLSLGKKHFDEQDFILLKRDHLVCVHPDTGKGEGPAFVDSKKGDLFYVCRSNDTIEFIGMFTDSRPLYSTIANKEEEGWVDREYRILLSAQNKTKFDKSLNTKIMPRFQSTFTLITKNEFDLFEKEILQPVFNISFDAVVDRRNYELNKITLNIDDYIAMQLDFNALMTNEAILFQKVNALTNIELKKIEYSYIKRGDISSQPVVLLRSKLLEILLEGKRLDANTIVDVKQDISASFEKNVYQAWSSNFRILYTFLFDKHKSELESYFKNLIIQFQKDLEIRNDTKIKLVHFDGAQNQGQDRLWFAIYNKVNNSQKLAKQLFFAIDNGLTYGLLNHGDPTKNELKLADIFDYQDVLDTFKLHKQTILSDNSMEKAKISEYIDILEYKNQIILQGPPGTGKTYTAKDIAEQILTGDITSDKKKQAQVLKDSNQFELVQFHPSYTYEDFVRGIVVESQDDKVAYKTKNKTLGIFAKTALENYNSSITEIKLEKKYVLIIDEINRANLPSVLGELIYALEYRGQSVKSMYTLENGDQDLQIPGNIYIIGTMNTADRSVGHIDYAIRRRFAFVELLPKELTSIGDRFKREVFKLVSSLFVKEIKINGLDLEASEHLSPEFAERPQDVWLGHSYFIVQEDEEGNEIDFNLRLQYEVIPILEEYVKDGILRNSIEVKNIIKGLKNDF